MNDEDWMKKRRRHKGGGCTAWMLLGLVVLVGALAG
jgi:hypothetical protein